MMFRCTPCSGATQRFRAGERLLLKGRRRDRRGRRKRDPHTHKDLATFFNRLVDSVSAEHVAETQQREALDRNPNASRIRSLLAGDLVDHRGLDYEFNAWHLAVVAAGQEVKACLTEAATGLDRRILFLQHSHDQAWAWFGGRRKLLPDELERCILPLLPQTASMAIGEPGEGIAGWRHSHQQATAALPIAKGGHNPVVRYGSNALLASMLQDDLLLHSLKRLCLSPLEERRNGEQDLVQTLHAYIAADRQVASASSNLGVSRKTVSNRLGKAEELLGRPLTACAPDLEAALLMDRASPLSE